jgi:DNA (cytosine-5)-methyltransferase 1
VRELALFAGAGGGILGGGLLGWRTVCAVELATFPRAVLLARQRDELLDPFPVWDDIKTFDARVWRGHVDVVSGGFPCQLFSSAARGRNNAEDLWPEMLRVVRECEPRFVFAENVKRGPIEAAASDLHRLGYTCKYARLDAAWVGAPHHRERWWLVADADSSGESRRAVDAETPRLREAAPVEWWDDDTEALGVSDGLAHRVDRLRALGNGQVPAVAAAAWRLLGAGTR